MTPNQTTKTRFCFERFVVSPARRVVLCDGREVPLIPRYFDLLLLLIERRGEAIHRREILDAVWSDVVVSDGALSQAVRTLRRVLDDDPRQPTFIRTVPRHGYRFVYADVVEEAEDNARPVVAQRDSGVPDRERELEALCVELCAPTTSAAAEDRQRDAAERVHQLGTADALRLIGGDPRHAAARALLRDTRWDVAGAGPVPILGRPGGLRALAVLFRLRLRRVLRLAGSRWLSAIVGAAVAGVVAGLLGAVALRFGPGSTATNVIFVALPLVGCAAAGLGAAGVAGGLCAAEVLIRSRRGVALVVGGAMSGGFVGSVTHLIGRWVFEGVFGGNLAPVAGGIEGLIIGAAVGFGYALATPTTDGGMAAPHGATRIRAALTAGVATALATGLLGWSGSHLGAMSLDFMAQTFPGSQVGLGPLANLLGEDAPGPVTRVVISTWEGLMFGGGLVLGLTRRPHRC